MRKAATLTFKTGSTAAQTANGATDARSASKTSQAALVAVGAASSTRSTAPQIGGLFRRWVSSHRHSLSSAHLRSGFLDVSPSAAYSRELTASFAGQERVYVTTSFPLAEEDADSKTSAASRGSHESSVVSSRALEAVKLLPTYLADARDVKPYDPVENPDGVLQLSVAENQMLEDLLVPSISHLMNNSSASSSQSFLPPHLSMDAHESFTANQIYYQPTHGRLQLREVASKYLTRLLSLSSNEFDLDGFVLGAGCNAVLENLCFCLGEPGDVVLIPTPYYAAFEFDLVARAGLVVQPFRTSTNDAASGSLLPVEAYYPNRASLDAALEASQGNARILLLSHPNNPLGISYPKEVVQLCIDWCRENSVHLVSDEIYAGSTYDGSFVSALKLASTPSSSGLGLGDYVHFVYALSKDFALSGLRVGIAYSENLQIRMPFQKLNDLCQMSSQTQVLVERMLGTEVQGDASKLWSTDVFLPLNNERLRVRSFRLQELLSKWRLPHLAATAGLFVWIDMREFLTRNDERALYLEMLHNYGLLLTPGLSMRHQSPGFFRCVFSAASDEEFDLALVRLENFVKLKRHGTEFK